MGRKVYLQNYRRIGVNLDHMELYFDVLETAVKVRACLWINSNEDTLYLDNEVDNIIDIQCIRAHKQPFQWEKNKDNIVLNGVKGQSTLVIETEIFPEKNTTLSGLYGTGGALLTQCEAQGFRRIIPFFDRPDILTTYTVHIKANKKKYPVLLSNGNLVSEQQEGDHHILTYHDPFPKPSYLFALVAGSYVKHTDEFITLENQKVCLNIYTDASGEGLTNRAMAALKSAMHWDEQAYGRCYDLDIYNIVATADFNMGAMENKSLNIFNSKYVLADDSIATDADCEAIDAVIGHEYFHNWSGNRVTCENWFYLSLKEGLTVFREQEFMDSITQSSCNRIDQVNLVRSRQFKEDAGPMAHPVIPMSYEKIDNFYTMTIYEKGAEIIRMLKGMVGPEAFRQGMDFYFSENDGKAVSIDALLDAIAKAKDYDQTHFKLWYTQSGTPLIKFGYKFDSASKQLIIDIDQENPETPDKQEKMPLMIPVAIDGFSAEGEKLPGLARTLVLDKQSSTWTIDNIEQAPVLSVLRDFSSPVNLVLKEPSARNDIKRVIYDDDPFVRWDSARRIWINELKAQLESNTNIGLDLSELLEWSFSVSDAFDLASVCAAFPSWNEVFSSVKGVDLNHLKTTCEHVISQAADIVHDKALQFDKLHLGAVSSDPKDVAIRRLQGRCFFYLAFSNDASRQWVRERFINTSNMTLRVASLSALSHKEKDFQLMDHFYDNHAKKNPLVALKWFALESRVWRDGCIDRLRALQNHPAFVMKNPNCVYALIGGFTYDNPIQFHSADLSGYHFIANFLPEIDKINPQVASYIAKGLHVNWLPSSQYKEMTNIMNKLSKNDISANLREVLEVL